MIDLEARVRAVPDFPTPGILFRDLTPLWADPAALDAAIERLVEVARPLAPDIIVAAEARGWVLGGALARALGIGFAPARKPGRLPAATRREEYALEYGRDALEVHADVFAPGHRVLVHDDLLATGGTARAMCALVEGAGAAVAGCSFVVELNGLGGRAALSPHAVHSLLRMEAG